MIPTLMRNSLAQRLDNVVACGFAKVLPAAFALSALVMPASAAPNLVKNGDFEINNGAGHLLWKPVQDWNLVITGHSTPNLGVHSLATLNSGSLPMWGTGAYANGNGFRSSNNGGFFIINDADPQYRGAFEQVIDGLIPGNQYELTFEYAYAHEAAANGNTWQYIYGNFGSDNFQTFTVNLPSHGFDGGPAPADGNGWYTFTETYTATSTSQALRFVANGGPAGLPPMALVDGVSLRDVTPTPGPLPVIGVAATLAWSRGLRRRIKRSVMS